jgi:hypothetical protein
MDLDKNDAGKHIIFIWLAFARGHLLAAAGADKSAL